jgi:eukaryotic-like serine/threonine-protein kinase
MDIIVDGRYQIVKRIGKGGFAHTYLAKNLTAPGEPKCLLKQLRPKVDHPRVLDLFRQEAAVLSRFDRPQIPKAIEYFEHQGDFYLVQDFIPGDDLRQEFTIGHQWSEAKVIQFLAEMLDVLRYIHDRQAIHRDIKPANIIRRWDSGKLCAIDFGAVLDLSNEPLMLLDDLDDDLPILLELDRPAMSLNSTQIQILDLEDESPAAVQIRVSANKSIVGTPGYQSPEQKNGNATFSSDIYALGMTAIQFLTGQYPLHLPRNEAKELVWRDLANVSEELASILDRMTQFELADRYQSTALVLADLNPLIAKVEDLTTAKVDPPIDRRFNQKALAVLMVLSLGSIGVGVAIGTTQLSPAKVTIEAKIHSPIRSIV